MSGTGALRNGGDFLTKQLGKKICYVSDPTWGNHNMVFRDAGFQEVRKYRYWKKDTRYVSIKIHTYYIIYLSTGSMAGYVYVSKYAGCKLQNIVYILT